MVANSTVLVAPVLAAKLAGVPVIVHAQEAPKSTAARRLYRFHGAMADTVVAISPGIAEALGKPRARVLLNPVGIPLPPSQRRAPRPDGAPLRLIVLGTVDRHKRQDLAIAALSELVAGGVDATLDLVGLEADASYAAQLREQVARAGLGGRVLFEGQRSDVAERLLAADALLLPAGEVTPLVLMEAMAQGTPVVRNSHGQHRRRRGRRRTQRSAGRFRRCRRDGGRCPAADRRAGFGRGPVRAGAPPRRGAFRRSALA